MTNKSYIAAGALIIGGGLFMAYRKSLPRGVRNNNPLNIRESAGDHTQWKGESAFNTDKAFEEFRNPAYGFRAGARILRSYHRQGYRTLNAVISRFAPPSENNTELYIQQVSKWAGIDRNQAIDVNDTEQLAKLLHAMSRKEVGPYYGLSMARKGVLMA